MNADISNREARVERICPIEAPAGCYQKLEEVLPSNKRLYLVEFFYSPAQNQFIFEEEYNRTTRKALSNFVEELLCSEKLIPVLRRCAERRGIRHKNCGYACDDFILGPAVWNGTLYEW